MQAALDPEHDAVAEVEAQRCVQIENGQHVNAEPRDQVNPFPSMLVITRGRTEAKIGGRQLTLHAKQTVLIPAGVSHEFWNPYDEPAEGILLMFGEGA